MPGSAQAGMSAVNRSIAGHAQVTQVPLTPINFVD